ncbi:hypothetical protein GCM10009096_15660 [Parasphingorhabdus litoris]|uniref:Uncharacterized protein n=1 Tax=Parasphingorhabdus litoris TaxID=394733 RepID=A0ABN1AF42_9SPHN|nr:hypothetical protein [Parasphingorhabdus litoris]
MGEFRHIVSGDVPVSEPSTRNLWQRTYRAIKPDWVFGFLLLVSITMLIAENLDPEPVIAVDPLMKILALSGLTLVIAFIATYAAAMDRRKVEDYFFQLMINGAIVGIITTLFVNLAWDLLYGPLMGDDLIAVMLASWSLGYFFYRIRGLNL